MVVLGTVGVVIVPPGVVIVLVGGVVTPGCWNVVVVVGADDPPEAGNRMRGCCAAPRCAVIDSRTTAAIAARKACLWANPLKRSLGTDRLPWSGKCEPLTIKTLSERQGRIECAAVGRDGVKVEPQRGRNLL